MPTPITLAEAIAELKRIGPVYDAACAYRDNVAYNPVGRANDLIRAVEVARPDAPEHKGRAHPIGDAQVHRGRNWDDLIPR